MKLLRFLTLSLLLTFAVCAYSAEGDLLDVRDTQDAPVNLIFDTDIGGDIDDAFALALIHRFADRGQCNFLGVTLTTATEAAARYVAAENAAFGRPDLPVGLLAQGTTYDSYCTATLEQKLEDGSAEFPVPDGFKPEEPVALLRRLLANAEDHSVVIAQVGYSTNLAALLDSPADDVSPLTGKELVAKKVRLVSVMGGSFGIGEGLESYAGRCEWNIICDVPAAQKLTNEWPGTIVYSGSEIGERVLMSTVNLLRDYRSHRAKFLHDSYYWWAQKNAPNEGFKHQRPTWDLTSVLFVLRPEEGRDYYTVSEPANITFDDKGSPTFAPNADGKRFIFLMTPEQCVRVRETFVNLCSEP